MKKISSILKTSFFKDLPYNDKIKITSMVKDNWKHTIIALAVIVCGILIVASSFIGKVHNYDTIINIAMIILSIVDSLFILYNNKKFNKNLNKFKAKI